MSYTDGQQDVDRVDSAFDPPFSIFVFCFFYTFAVLSACFVHIDCNLISVNQSINTAFVRCRYMTCPGAPTIVSGKHDQKVHS